MKQKMVKQNCLTLNYFALRYLVLFSFMLESVVSYLFIYLFIWSLNGLEKSVKVKFRGHIL